MRSPIQTRRHQHGFSLIELSIALAVIGVVVAGGLSMSTSMVDRQAYVQTGNQMDEIEKAIAAYVAVNNRLPCPADPAPAMGGIGFGVEVANCSALDPMSPPGDLVAANGTGGRQTWIGTLPVRTLGLRDRFIADEYGNRYTYAVTSAMTTTAGYENSPPVVANNGAITLQDGNGALIIDDAAYTVVSHGGDSKGAYRFESASNSVPCVGGLDAENCDGDAVFRDARFNRGSVAANYFDDTTRFARREIINMTAAAASGTDDNSFWEANGNHIFNTNTENVGVGIANPAEAKLQVYGNTFGQPAIKAVHDMNGIAVHGVGQGASPSFFAEFDDQNGVGYRADNLGWGGRLFEGIGDDSMNVGMFLDMSGEDSTGVNISASGTNSAGVIVESNNTLGTGIRSSSYTATGLTYAIHGQIASDTSDAAAIYGQATAANGSVQGVHGTSASQSGNGVKGTNTNALGGDAIVGQSTNGRGVVGISMATVGGTPQSNNGVWGASRTPTGAGVYADAQHASGVNYGLYARSISTQGHGVYGIASGGWGTTYGVYGQAISATGYGVYCAGSLCGGTVAWTPPSDIRLKEHVVTLDDKTYGLDAIRKLRPVTYDWKDMEKKRLGKQLGFIAQEVEQVIPELIVTGADYNLTLSNGKKEVVKKTKAMAYETLTVPLVRAVQQLADALDDVAKDVSELLAKVYGHDAKIKVLEAENASLKLRLDAIEKKLAE